MLSFKTFLTEISRKTKTRRIEKALQNRDIYVGFEFECYLPDFVPFNMQEAEAAYDRAYVAWKIWKDHYDDAIEQLNNAQDNMSTARRKIEVLHSELSDMVDELNEMGEEVGLDYKEKYAFECTDLHEEFYREWDDLVVKVFKVPEKVDEDDPDYDTYQEQLSVFIRWEALYKSPRFQDLQDKIENQNEWFEDNYFTYYEDESVRSRQPGSAYFEYCRQYGADCEPENDRDYFLDFYPEPDEDYSREFISDNDNDAKDLATQLKKVFPIIKTIEFEQNRAQKIGDTHWRVEKDSSLDFSKGGIEIISPPLPLPDAIKFVQRFFNFIETHGYTNSDTGLHVNISHIGGMKDIDRLKMLLLIDEGYIWNVFPDRKNNRYTQNVVKALSRVRGKVGPKEINDAMQKNKAEIDINPGKMYGINFTNLENGRIEFRYPGGSNYSQKAPEFINMVGVFADTLLAGRDPNYKKQEYIEKLSRIVYKIDEMINVYKFVYAFHSLGTWYFTSRVFNDPLAVSLGRGLRYGIASSLRAEADKLAQQGEFSAIAADIAESILTLQYNDTDSPEAMEELIKTDKLTIQRLLKKYERDIQTERKLFFQQHKIDIEFSGLSLYDEIVSFL